MGVVAQGTIGRRRFLGIDICGRSPSWPESSAASMAASSTIFPSPCSHRKVPGLMWERKSALIICRVWAVNGIWREIKSALRMSSPIQPTQLEVNAQPSHRRKDHRQE